MRKKFYLLAFFLPILFWIIIFVINGITPFGNKTLAINDAYEQYVNFSVYGTQYIKEGFPGYSMKYGLGFETNPLISYYCSSPFNLFYFIPLNPYIMYGLITILKSALTCLACYFVFARKKSQGIYSLSAAVSYTFCGFIANHFYSSIWTDAFLLFPLIFFFLTEYMEKENKKYLLPYSVLLFIAVFSNFYMAYGICLFIIIVFFMHYSGSMKDMVKKGSIIFICSLISILPNAYRLFNTAKYLISNKVDGTDVYNFKFIDIFKSFLFGYNETYSKNSYIYLYIGIFGLIMLVAALFRREYIYRKKLMFLLAAAFLIALVKPLNLLFHAGDSPNYLFNRFAYMFSFLFIYYLYEFKPSKKDFMLGCNITVMAVCIASLIKRFGAVSYGCVQDAFLVYTLIFAGIYFSVTILEHRRFIPVIIIGEMFLNILIITSTYSFLPIKENTDRNQIAYERIESIRYYNTSESVSFSSSTVNKGLSKYLYPLIKNSGDVYIKNNPYNYFTASILGMKGVTEKDFMDSQGAYHLNNEIYWFDYPLSIGFVIKNDIRNLKLPNDTVDANNLLFSKMTGINENIVFRPDADVSVSNNCYKITFNDNYKKISVTSGNDLKKVCFNGKELEDYYKIENFCFNDIKKGDFIEFYSSSDIGFDIDFYSFDEETYKKGYNILKSQQLKISKYSNKYISGDIYLNKESYVFFSIGYNNGWRIYVDDKEYTGSVSVNEALYQLKLPAGNHKIQFVWKKQF